MKARFAPSYSTRNALSNGTRNSVSNFCAELYLFPERVTYDDITKLVKTKLCTKYLNEKTPNGKIMPKSNFLILSMFSSSLSS